MKKKIGVVLLCVAMFIAGCVVTGVSWRGDVAKLKEQNAMLREHNDTMEEMLQDNHDRILELSSEVTELKLKLLQMGE